MGTYLSLSVYLCLCLMLVKTFGEKQTKNIVTERPLKKVNSPVAHANSKSLPLASFAGKKVFPANDYLT